MDMMLVYKDLDEDWIYKLNPRYENIGGIIWM